MKPTMERLPKQNSQLLDDWYDNDFEEEINDDDDLDIYNDD